MSDITFLGLGLMGSALAETIIKAGHDVVVWNRNPSKAEALVAMGAQYVSDPAEAIDASPIAVVCVGNYDAADSFLRTPESLAALKGRVLVQLTSGSARAGRSTQAWAKEAGAMYLDGGIMAYPSDIGTTESMFLVAGDEDGYAQAEPFLRILAPKLEYLGDDPARASALFLAMLSAECGLMFGILNGAALCEATGIPSSQFTDLIKSDFGTSGDGYLENAIKYENNDLDKTEAFLRTWAEGLDPMAEMMEDAGYNPDFPKFLRSVLNVAIERGWGEQDIGALIKVLRPN